MDEKEITITESEYTMLKDRVELLEYLCRDMWENIEADGYITQYRQQLAEIDFRERMQALGLLEEY